MCEKKNSILLCVRRFTIMLGDAFLVLVVLDKLLWNNLFLISTFLYHDD